MRTYLFFIKKYIFYILQYKTLVFNQLGVVRKNIFSFKIYILSKILANALPNATHYSLSYAFL